MRKGELGLQLAEAWSGPYCGQEHGTTGLEGGAGAGCEYRAGGRACVGKQAGRAPCGPQWTQQVLSFLLHQHGPASRVQAPGPQFPFCVTPASTLRVSVSPPLSGLITGPASEGEGVVTRTSVLTSEAGGDDCLALVVPKSRPNTSRDFLKPPRSSEDRAGASSEAAARSGTSAPPTWWETYRAPPVSKSQTGTRDGSPPPPTALWGQVAGREEPQDEG